MVRRKIPEAEAKEMVAKERLWSRPFSFPLPPDPNSPVTNSTHDEESNAEEEVEDGPIDPEKNYLENLPIGK